MGDIGDYWRDAKAYRRSRNPISNQYMNENDREKGIAFKHEMNREEDERELDRLTKAGFNPIKKNTHSFQITIKGEKAMYYCGKNPKVVFNDGQKFNGGPYDLS